MSPQTLPRKGVVDTLTTALGWLSEYPLLAVVFLLAGIVDALGELNVVLAILGTVAMIFAEGVAYLTADRLAAGDPPELGAMAGQVFGRMLSLVGIFVVVTVLTVIGLVLLVVPGIYVWLRLSLSAPACVLEDEGTFDALSTSWDVAQGNLLKLFAIALTSFLVSLVAILPVVLGSVAVAETAGTEGIGLLLGTAGVLLGAVVSPVVQMAFARVYLENRSTGPMGSTGTSTVDDGFGTP